MISNLSKHKYVSLLLWVPIINLLFDFIQRGVAFRSQLVLLQYFILGAIILLSYVFKQKYFKVEVIVYVFILYLFVSIQFSSDKFYSVNAFLKIIIPYFLFICSYKNLNKSDHLFSLINISFYVMICFVIYMAAANFLGFGESIYSKNDDDFSAGFLSGPRLYQVIFGICLLPFLSDIGFSNKKKYIIILFSFGTLLWLLATTRRTPIISIGLFSVMYIYFLKRKGKYIKKIVLFLVFGLIVSSFFFSFLSNRFAVRENKLERTTDIQATLEGERRFLEFYVVYEDINDNIVRFLVGTNEMLNSKNNYGHYDLVFYEDRRLHVDYTLLAHGGGIVALFLFLFISFNQYSIIRKYKYLNSIELYDKLYSTAISLIIVSLFISISGGIDSVSYRSLLFLLLGSIAGNFKRANNEFNLRSA